MSINGLDFGSQTLTEFVYKKDKMCGKCPFCKASIPYEIYCYKCYNKINIYGEKMDMDMEKYIKKTSYIELNTMISKVRQAHNNCITVLSRKKKMMKSLGVYSASFNDNVKIELFKSYKKLHEYSKKNINTLFNNKKFNKKLLIKIDLELKSEKNIFATDKYVYEYDRQLFLTRTVGNLKSVIETVMKNKMKNHKPGGKTGNYMRYTKRKDGTLNQGKKYAYGKILDIIDSIKDKVPIIQVFREYKIKDLVKGETMFFDGLLFIKVSKKEYHPIVIELDDKTHDRLHDSKYRLNDLAKNIFCKKNGVSMIRLDTVDFNKKILLKILNVILKSKNAKLAAMKNYESKRIEHFNKLTKTYDMLEFLNK
jgi:hypothetical protein